MRCSGVLSRAAVVATVGLSFAAPTAAQAGSFDTTLQVIEISPSAGLSPRPVVALFGGFGDAPLEIEVTRDGSANVVITKSADSQGIRIGSSGDGLPACTTTRNVNRFLCGSTGVEGVLLSGTPQDDVLDATAAGLPAFLSAGQGDDTLTAAALPASAGLQQVVSGGSDDDVVNGSAGPDLLFGEQPNVQNPEFDGNDTLLGGAGADVLEGGPGSDAIDGGDGTDDHVYGAQPGPAVITLGDGLCNDGTPSDAADAGDTAPAGCSANGVDRDLLRRVENATGTANDSPGLDDDIVGTDGPNVLSGLAGDDRVEGGPGADSIFGNTGGDELLARDANTPDAATVCGDDPASPTAGDRAVADPEDPVDPSCAVIERGPAGTPGPVGTPPGEVTPNVPTTGSEGSGPGGGDGGVTPPELEITSPNATVKNGKAELRVRCVYLAQACVGDIELEAKKDAKAGKGRKRVKVEKGDSLGAAELEIPWGTSEPTRVRVARAVKSFFKAGADKLLAVATVRARDGAAGPGAARARVERTVRLGAAGRG